MHITGINMGLRGDHSYCEQMCYLRNQFPAFWCLFYHLIENYKPNEEILELTIRVKTKYFLIAYLITPFL